jgi:hypothetical protein
MPWRAVALAPNDPETHLALASTRYGKIVPVSKGTSSGLSRRVLIKNAAADKVLCTFEHPKNDLAWHVFGPSLVIFQARQILTPWRRAWAQVA